jgi:hypothetical protein
MILHFAGIGSGYGEVSSKPAVRGTADPERRG